MPDLALSLNSFSLELTNQLSAASTDNFFVSPFSIMTALAMCYLGAKNETASQLKNLLHLSDYEDNEQLLQEMSSYLNRLNSIMSANVSLSTANKIYPRIGFTLDNQFVEQIRNGFGGDVEELDYAKAAEAASTINGWVAAQTANKIANLISPSAITRSTLMILINAIYFKGDWAKPFEARRTAKRNFNLLDGSAQQCDMMQLNEHKFGYLDKPFGLECKSLEMPYVGEQVAMTIILPNEGVDINAFQSSLKATHIHDLVTLNKRKVEVNVQIPKFKLERKYGVSGN